MALSSHCALQFCWQVEATKDLVPGLRTCANDFDKIVPEEGLEEVAVTSSSKIQIREFEAEDRMSLLCVAFPATAEASGTLGTHTG